MRLSFYVEIFMQYLCSKGKISLGFGLRNSMDSIFKPEENLSYLDKFILLLTQNKIFKISSMSYIFDSLMLATWMDLKTDRLKLVHLKAILTWIIAYAVKRSYEFIFYVLFVCGQFFSIWVYLSFFNTGLPTIFRN